MSTLNIHERRIGEVTILDMDGNIRIGGSNVALKKAIQNLVAEGRNQIVLNLARVTYIDSSGLGELISSHVTSNHKGGQIKLLNLTQRFHELMTITKLITIFDVYTDESQAVHSFKIHDAIAVAAAPGMTSAPF
ncbi:MAG TPA: STAS domain-containing protein [Pyrinomonadaceae bacterium]|nr:STAS domain-containing protein [Pyrinomonadaceae bacterium]